MVGELDPDELEDVEALERGTASSDVEEDDERTAATIFLYIPDLSSWTGWAAYRVRREDPPPDREIGFRPRDKGR